MEFEEVGTVSRRVVITGMGAVTPLGNDVSSTWEGMKEGRSGIALISRFDASEYATQFGGEVKDFDPTEVIDRKEARRMDRVTHLAIAASHEAVTSSGLLESPYDPARVGVLIGSAVGGMDTLVQQAEVLRTRGGRRLNPFFIPMILVDTPGAQVAIRYGFRGHNIAVVAACATGSAAIGEAFEIVARGAADAMLAGGTEAGPLEITLAGFNVMGALSTRNDDPPGACRPFDADRDGFVVSEGAVVLVLESLDHALARGATILGEIVGYGASSDANHMAAPLEDGSGASQAMQAALDRAEMKPEDVDYINAHGTATPLNDVIETRAIKATFGDHAKKLIISSTKSVTGHLLAGAGAVEAMACAKVISDGVVPPTINLDNPDPECDLDYVPHKAREAVVNVALSNSFGFGGHNACLILKRYEA
jgi:3-oxoacyl-[acyl-carrier-protein] synthase II